jgi:hypothetical protein
MKGKLDAGIFEKWGGINYRVRFGRASGLLLAGLWFGLAGGMTLGRGVMMGAGTALFG